MSITGQIVHKKKTGIFARTTYPMIVAMATVATQYSLLYIT